MKPPKAAQRVQRYTHFGRVRSDPYSWLKAENWRAVFRDSAACPKRIARHLEAENEWTAHALKPLGALRRRLEREMRARIPAEDDSVPLAHSGWLYYARNVKGGEHIVLCRRARGRKEEVLLNGNSLARRWGKFFSFGGFTPSPDNRLLAWTADYTGGEYYELRLRDLRTRRDTAARILNTGGSAVWAADSRHLFYIRVDENHRPAQVFRHSVGGGAEDVLVYEEKNPGYFLALGKTGSGRFITLSSHDHESSEVRIIDALAPASAPDIFARRRKGVMYDIEDDPARKRWLILTNDGARNYRIAQAPAAKRETRHWKTLIRGRKRVLRLAMLVTRKHLIWAEREDGGERIVVHSFSRKRERVIDFEAPSSLSLGAAALAGGVYDSSQIRIRVSSMREPERVYDYALASPRRVLRKKQLVPAHDSALYETARIFALAADGERIPVSLLWRKGVALPAPLLLYGYGAYGLTIPASFASTRLSLADRGFVYAIAHIRGGRARGEDWYRDGKLGKKKNSFTDFIAAAKHLAARGWTQSGQIVIHGGSAGGLLVGAAANLAPDLFRAVLAQVPFVDVLATMLDKDLPLTPPEWPEWGNPLKSRRAYDTIAAYSPYDNIRQAAYPHILATGGLSDPRVGYWEPAKWVARLRERSGAGNLICLRTDMGSGHGGKSGRYERLEEVALLYAFALRAHEIAGRV